MPGVTQIATPSEKSDRRVLVETECGKIIDTVRFSTGHSQTESAHRVGTSDLIVDHASVNGNGLAEHKLFNTAHPVITNSVIAKEVHAFSFEAKPGCQILGASVRMTAEVSGKLEGTLQEEGGYAKAKAKFIPCANSITPSISIVSVNPQPLTLRHHY